MLSVRETLFSMQDTQYKQFHQALMPTVDADKVIGVRTPLLRKLAKELFKADNTCARALMNTLPHKYYEENNLHAFLIEQLKDYDEAIYETERFLPHIDNWATCDMFLPSVFKKNTDMLLFKIKEWLCSNKVYTVRYAIGLLMKLYLDELFDPQYHEAVATLRSDEYYIKMMVAWYFATALSKQYDATIGYITEKRLDVWTHNKAIQKAVESRRISNETKAYLRTLKLKSK